MLEEAQLAAGPQHPADLAQRRFLVEDGAQHKGDDGGVETRVACGQRAG